METEAERSGFYDQQDMELGAGGVALRRGRGENPVKIRPRRPVKREAEEDWGAKR